MCAAVKTSDGELRMIGRLKTKPSADILASRFSIGFECIDREMFDPCKVYPHLAKLGVKWARVQTGWARTERVKGTYDFSWLDVVVDKLIAIGIQPWFNVTYGNRLYSPDAPHELATGWAPVYSADGREGWANFCRALAAHYKSRIRHYEIWNEPDAPGFWANCASSSRDYNELVAIAAQSIRGAQPEAKIIGGAVSASHFLPFIDQLFSDGLGTHIDIFSYHLYSCHPEAWFSRVLPPLRRLINRRAPHVELWQGESGAVSQSEENQELCNFSINWNQRRQAKQLARRTMLDLIHGTALFSYFHASDFTHYIWSDRIRDKRSYYGLVGGDDYVPKAAYQTLQTLCTLFPGETRVLEDATCITWSPDSGGERFTEGTRLAVLESKGTPVVAYWYPQYLSEDFPSCRVEVIVYFPDGCRFSEPVLIDPITQNVFAVDFYHERKNQWSINKMTVPLEDYPLILAEKRSVEIKEEET